MTAQPQLFDPGVKLTDKQQHAYDLVAGKGATALEVGIALHTARECRHCKPERPCQYAESGGRAVLWALRKKGLVVRRRETGRWQQTGKPVAAPTSAPEEETEGENPLVTFPRDKNARARACAPSRNGARP
jgi:hypothetical protein